MHSSGRCDAVYGVFKKEMAEGRYKINHLQYESWQMEIINHAVEEAEQAAEIYKEHGLEPFGLKERS